MDEYEFSTFLDSLKPVIDSIKDVHNPIIFMEKPDAEAQEQHGG
jgi:hypothetical protein